MAERIKQFTWYMATNEETMGFFFAAPGHDLATSPYNAFGFQKEVDGAWKYVGATGYNSSNPSIWREVKLPKEIPSAFLTYIIKDLFSARLNKTLWQK